MSEITKYQCDITGNVLDDPGDVLKVPLKRQRGGGSVPYEVYERTSHISTDYLEEAIGHLYPQEVEYLAVGMLESGCEVVVGAVLPYRNYNNDTVSQYRERGDVTIDQYEGFFQLIEEEILL